MLNYSHFIVKVKKKELQKDAKVDKELLSKSSLAIELLPETKQDIQLASVMKLESTECNDFSLIV